MIVAYMEAKGSAETDKWVNFSDLIVQREPDFVLLDRGDLLLTMESNREILPLRSWTLKALYRVRDIQWTGDALDFYFDLALDLDSANHASERRIVIHRPEVLRQLNWFPSPNGVFKPLPANARKWLEEVKGLRWPAEMLPPAQAPGTK